MESIDIKIKQINKQEFINLKASQLILEITGANVNYVLVNTLRRLCYDCIPTYAFSPENITIEKNLLLMNDYFLH